MIIWCPRKMTGAKMLVTAINQLGVEAKRVVGGPCPDGAIRWGRGGGSKFKELELLEAAGIPVPPHSRTKKPGWLARTEQHHEAKDLLAGLTEGDFYVEYVPTIREHRVHIVAGKSVRVQGKVPRIPNPHPKFRSWSSGWKLAATPDTTATLPKGAREYAKKAVAAMGYQFGAVDIGTKANGSPIVWEVNSGPGIEGGTVKVYAEAFIREWGE